MKEKTVQLLDTASLTKSESFLAYSANAKLDSFLRKKSHVSCPQATSIYGGTLTSASASSELPTHPEAPKSVTPAAPAPAINSANWSTSLQAVLDQPPASLPQKMMLGGLVFCIAFGAWATFGQIDEVGTARGILAPKGDVYKIHPVESGKIASIRVKEGQVVKAGQELVELETEFARQDVERLQQLLAADKIQLGQMQSMMEKTRLQAESRAAIANAETQAQKAALAQAQEKAATVQNLLTQLQTDINADHARLERLQPLPTLSQERITQLQINVEAHKARMARLKPLADQGAISKEQLFATEQAIRESQSAITNFMMQDSPNVEERVEQADQAIRDRYRNISQSQGELKQALAQSTQLQAVLTQKQAEGNTAQIEAQQQIQQKQVEMTKLKAKIAENENLLTSAKAKLNQRFLYAPVDGVVSSLNVHNMGEMVQTGQTIAEMARNGAPLVLSASLPNQQAGFVKVGMPVQVKMDAYPYQNYGIITGKVTSISPSAKPDERLGQVYQLEVALESNSIKANQQTIQFKAGQTATAEIVIRPRRIIDILLDPIKQLQKGGINL